MTNINDSELSASRKDDHIRLALEQARQVGTIRPFDDLRFVHNAVAAIDVQQVNLSSQILGFDWKVPLYINAMTGGNARSHMINSMLGESAARTGVALASGSMSQIFKNPGSADSFRVLRDKNPGGFIFANLSANATVEQAIDAVALLEANALQIHVNSVQEIVMDEGDRKFSSWLGNIARIVEALRVPVLVKEVGFGLSHEAVNELVEIGVEHVDCAGSGGTNFAKIEASRSVGGQHTVFGDWGLTTPECLMEMTKVTSPKLLTILASGGVQNPMDVALGLGLGAKAVGVAGVFLRTLEDGGQETLSDTIDDWIGDLKKIFAVLGASSPHEMQKSQIIVSGKTRSFARARGINFKALATRTKEEVY